MGDPIDPLVLVDRQAAGLAVVTLNRPQAMNALSVQLRGELAAAIVAPYVDEETTWVVRHHGVRAVIDSGLARSARFDPRRGMSGLVTTPVSRAAADQRRGAPDLALRGERGQPEHDDPDQRTRAAREDVVERERRRAGPQRTRHLCDAA